MSKETKSAVAPKSGYSIAQYRIEQEKCAHEQAEIKRRITEECLKYPEEQRQPGATDQIQPAQKPACTEALSDQPIAGYEKLPVRVAKSVEQILHENYDQEKYLIYDIVGFRRVKCTKCSSIRPEKEIIKYETCNKGVCSMCFSRK